MYESVTYTWELPQPLSTVGPSCRSGARSARGSTDPAGTRARECQAQILPGSVGGGSGSSPPETPRPGSRPPCFLQAPGPLRRARVAAGAEILGRGPHFRRARNPRRAWPGRGPGAGGGRAPIPASPRNAMDRGCRPGAPRVPREGPSGLARAPRASAAMKEAQGRSGGARSPLAPAAPPAQIPHVGPGPPPPGPAPAPP